MLIRYGIWLSGLLGIHLSLRKLVMFLDIYPLILVHSLLGFIMPLFGVTYVILLTMRLIRVPIMNDMLNLTLHHPGTILMLS